ncbi:hypothetical protein B0H11DRAFT_2257594 [Mycena galericulata]|nr:hypothetical protein B0H11DRAFT_2257594 [Mycena galericulata]
MYCFLLPPITSPGSFTFFDVDLDGSPLLSLQKSVKQTFQLLVSNCLFSHLRRPPSLFPADGSFVGTSSDPAAHEFKKCYDQHYGVGVSIRSLYAIAALITGRQMYRVGKREKKSPPAAMCIEADERVLQPNTPVAPGGTRRTSSTCCRRSHWLPLLKKLAAAKETTVIKMSLSMSLSSNNATARSPVRHLGRADFADFEREQDDMSTSQGSQTDGSSSAPSSSGSKKRSVRSGKGKSSIEVPVLKLSLEDVVPKILVAATIERWIAQLTSDPNYDELLNFFLTYRTYISAVALSLPPTHLPLALCPAAANIDAGQGGAARRAGADVCGDPVALDLFHSGLLA